MLTSGDLCDNDNDDDDDDDEKAGTVGKSMSNRASSVCSPEYLFCAPATHPPELARNFIPSSFDTIG